MNITYHDELEANTPWPGVTRTICMDRQFGSGAITQGIVVVQPGAAVLPHTHLVEDSVTVLDGDTRILVGEDVVEVRGRRVTFLAPANTAHAVQNIGDRPSFLCYAQPAVGVTSQQGDIEF